MSFVSKKASREYSKIYRDYGEEIKRKYQLNIGGTGGSEPDDIAGAYYYLESRKEVAIDFARLIYIDIVQGFVEKINSSRVIRPYLHEFPVDEHFFGCTLCFSEEKAAPGSGLVAFMFHNSTGIHYEGYDLKKKEYVTIHEEPYSEALKIVQNAKPNNDHSQK